MCVVCVVRVCVCVWCLYVCGMCVLITIEHLDITRGTGVYKLNVTLIIDSSRRTSPGDSGLHSSQVCCVCVVLCVCCVVCVLCCVCVVLCVCVSNEYYLLVVGDGK